MGPPLLTTATAAGALSNRTGMWILRGWSALELRILGVDVELEDRTGGLRAPPYVFVQLNQGSLLDVLPWIQSVDLPVRPIINVEFALLPFLGWALTAGGGIVVVRQWSWQARRAMARAEAALRAGSSVGVSIEGRRSPDGTLLPYKKGPVMLALRAGAPLVPVVFHGTAARLPYGEWRVRPGKVRVTLCEPVETRGLTVASRDLLVEKLRSVAQAELQRA
ncbi:MAG: lysophospholipid acyltransferase family protein [Myxococcota bacterium]